MKWKRALIQTDRGPVTGIAPEIIAASRATDIPAFYADWFFHRLAAGYVRWLNPFNRRAQFVSLENARVIVFWSKNPAPLLPRLGELDARGVAHYLQFTCNDYEAEAFEPGLPRLARRVETFRRCADALRPERVVWRFDPMLLAGNLTCDILLDRAARLARQLAGYTGKLVFSFADVRDYRKVWENLRRAGVVWRDFSLVQMRHVASGLAAIGADAGMAVLTCGEGEDLSSCGVGRNRCIDPELILKLTGRHPDILRLLGLAPQEQGSLPGAGPEPVYLRDPGQRGTCLCAPCKDIGQYDTCPHGCVYCYANTSVTAASRRWSGHAPLEDSIAPA